MPNYKFYDTIIWPRALCTNISHEPSRYGCKLVYFQFIQFLKLLSEAATVDV